MCDEYGFVRNLMDTIMNKKIKSIVSISDIIQLNLDKKIGLPISSDTLALLIKSCDDGFVSWKDKTYPYTQYGPQVPITSESEFKELDKMIPEQSIISEKIGNKYKFINKTAFLGNPLIQLKFNTYQDENKPFYVTNYSTQETLNNRLRLFDTNSRLRIRIRPEIIKNVERNEIVLQKKYEDDIVNISSVPLFFTISCLNDAHLFTLLKINNEFYSIGFGFMDTTSTINEEEDENHSWVRLHGTVFSPDGIFVLNKLKKYKIIDIGILTSFHLDRIQHYLNDIQNIYISYIEAVNEDDQYHIDTHKRNGAIIPTEIGLESIHTGYHFSGNNVDPPAKNCVSFLQDIFINRIHCTDDSGKHFTFSINNPLTCKTNHNVDDWCSKFYQVLVNEKVPFGLLSLLTNYKNPIRKSKLGKKVSKKNKKSNNKRSNNKRSNNKRSNNKRSKKM
jgi:hypothetical protein